MDGHCDDCDTFARSVFLCQECDRQVCRACYDAEGWNENVCGQCLEDAQ